MLSSKFSQNLSKIAKKTDDYLKKFFFKKNISPLIKPMKYGLFSGGKRFRSAIVVSTGKIFKIDSKKLIVIGAAIECIHSYSLMHDDLPAMDNDSLRRGKLSTHKKFNEFTAILAGNSLLTSAFEILSSRNLNLTSKTKNELVESLSLCCGYEGLARGQYSDLTFEHKKISVQKIINMQENKTGKLFGFCCESVGIIKNASLKEKKFLKNLGIKIGLLFQIVDDLIDCYGDKKIVGKFTKKDAVKGKATLVNLWGRKKSLSFAKKLKKEIKSKILKYGYKSNDLLQCVDFILKRKF
tara:strand:+ start:927 stop:1814 length:888 start_codon:yes stop_codon:yes gene_type:complete